MNPHTRIEHALRQHIEAVEGCLTQQRDVIVAVSLELAAALQQGNKILVCGNGGSACDAMHFAGELVGRFVLDRTPLPAIALTADPGILTAVGNDYGFEQIFERQVRAHGRAGDVLIGISTSGASRNVLLAIEAAQALNMQTLLLTGIRGKDKMQTGHTIWVPSDITAHIQETHITILQLMVAIIEDKLFYNNK